MKHAPLTCDIRINRGHRTRTEPKWLFEPGPGHFKDFDLWYVWAGSGTIEWKKEKHDIAFGSAILLRPRESIRVTNNPDNPLGVSVIHFDFLKNGKVIHPPESALPPRHCRVDNSMLMDALTASIVGALTPPDPVRRPEAERYLQAILTELCRRPQRALLPPVRIRQQERLQPILNEIQENPSRHFRVEELAKRVCWAPDYLTRVFKALLNETPSEFCIRVRIDRAKQLLQESTFTISEIAEMLGYPDIYCFSRQFKEKAGVPPSEFRG